MSIGIGFWCHEGIVLGTDTQYTAAWKLRGEKLFEIQTKDLKVCIAGAGDVSLIRKAVQLIKRAFQETGGSFGEIEEALERVLDTVYTKYVDSFRGPEESRPSLELLIGLSSPGSWTALLRTDHRIALPVDDYAVIGSGGPLVQYVVETLRATISNSEEDVKLLVLYALKAAKDYDPWSGKETALKILHKDGKIETAGSEEIRNAQSFLDGLFSTILHLITFIFEPALANDTFIDLAVSGFKRHVEEFRERERKRKEKEEKPATAPGKD